MKVNEIFYSLQGEGRWTGTPAVFVRFSGCNLKCPFCDTDHNEGIQLTEKEIITEVEKYPAEHVIFTGGEPTLQLTRTLVDELHDRGKIIHIETNGTIALPDNLENIIDWITVSPKESVAASEQSAGSRSHDIRNSIKIQRIDELKLLYQPDNPFIEEYSGLEITHPECRYLQPVDVGDSTRNRLILSSTIDYILRHPHWKLSLQTHKLLDIK